jgi:hypothetical protein
VVAGGVEPLPPGVGRDGVVGPLALAVGPVVGVLVGDPDGDGCPGGDAACGGGGVAPVTAWGGVPVVPVGVPVPPLGPRGVPLGPLGVALWPGAPVAVPLAPAVVPPRAVRPGPLPVPVGGLAEPATKAKLVT